jgi:hypothetical protein
MKILKRTMYNVKSFAYGLIIGCVFIVLSNSLGHVIMIHVMPNSIQVASEAMK